VLALALVLALAVLVLVLVLLLVLLLLLLLLLLRRRVQMASPWKPTAHSDCVGQGRLSCKLSSSQRREGHDENGPMRERFHAALGRD
jgi:hypothetical protein